MKGYWSHPSFTRSGYYHQTKFPLPLSKMILILLSKGVFLHKFHNLYVTFIWNQTVNWCHIFLQDGQAVLLRLLESSMSLTSYSFRPQFPHLRMERITMPDRDIYESHMPYQFSLLVIRAYMKNLNNIPCTCEHSLLTFSFLFHFFFIPFLPCSAMFWSVSFFSSLLSR